MNRNVGIGVLQILSALGLCVFIGSSCELGNAASGENRAYRFRYCGLSGAGCSFIWDFNTGDKTL
jgi:hypothetical protein